MARTFNEGLHFGRADQFEKELKEMKEKFFIKIIDDKIIQKQIGGLFKFLLSAPKYKDHIIGYDELSEADKNGFKEMIHSVAPNLADPLLTEVAMCLHGLGSYFDLKYAGIAE